MRGACGGISPPGPRYVALADVYDALTSKRVYKPAFAPDIARSMIVGESGKHFDPALVDAFVENEGRFLAIREQFAEQQMALA